MTRNWNRRHKKNQKPKPKPVLTRLESEVERGVIDGDRVELVQAAVEFSTAMLARHYWELSSSVPKPAKFLKGELETYRSALSFLKREWDKGSTESTLYESRCRVEDQCE
jgi:hypothetical protein